MRDWKLVETLPIHFLYPSRLSLSLSLSRIRAMVQGGEPVDLFFSFFLDKWAWVDVFCSVGLREEEQFIFSDLSCKHKY
jgi:hypothetical protein